MIKTIEISSSFDELEGIVDEAEAFFGQCFTDDEKVYTGVLLASEMVTNAIEHGNELVESKKVFIEFHKKDTTVELWVEDQGSGFVRESVSNPLSEEHLFDDGGRGIFLIEKLADKVLYEKEGRRVGVLFNL
ncbi:MAG: ATP-binding protein [Bacteroidetes Order II. Incertae sedis bacterium]|jgi:serine/threonine-protein kinase RsbW|nr:ATP-binding protein [Bacteroidetes Order II. bacterium]MDG1754970.1 ATP-binding protein [Rhodothermales bacterium]HAY36364.1 ATP-binding protein [Bacteroidota bacterium]MBT4051688.1 ATP-binding protein [Bacteroidetes Order II. bacterium]MBT4603716.1 ATP-binding protein [Bacteroidetes Order II. bacterium]